MAKATLRNSRIPCRTKGRRRDGRPSVDGGDQLPQFAAGRRRPRPNPERWSPQVNGRNGRAAIGIVRAKAKIGLQNLAYNIRRLVTLERMAAA
jgi:hypothetical protein